MFFKLHSENIIGYKKLSDADLGRGTSHQTHIGLYGNILTFLSDQRVEEEAMFIYDNECSMVDCYFDRIETPDGSFRSSKIRKGDRNAVSVVNLIRDYAHSLPDNYDWFLIWFGLESEKLVFYLFHNNSQDYKDISHIINLNRNSRLTSYDLNFSLLINYLENIINESGIEIIEELEILSQTGDNKKYKIFDIEKANELFKETGKLGEALIAEFLNKLKYQGTISNFSWLNQSQETALPYDFTVQTLNQNIIHIDVKATAYKFEQPMIFSSQEINFIKDTPYYHIYRVYDLSEDQKHLRICENSKGFMPDLHTCISGFQSAINAHSVNLQSVKLAVPTTLDRLLFRPEITL